MTRRRVLLALVVTVLAMGCAAPWWEELWLAVAYEQREDEFVTFRVKRIGFPGREFRIDSQVCRWCSKGRHSCPDGTYIIRTDDLIYDPAMNPDLEVWTTYSTRPEGTPPYCICPTCYPERQQ